ncbi:H-NS histone family protein [Roseicitreum antarcticum]|uniref:H-NS histone family protein n=1 Tax=Roseicitreum antarcticum TaxID=564137 RepID=UPI0037C4F042
MGYCLAELVGKDSKPKRAPVAPKYQQSDNPAITWSGRGRKPQWFVDAMAAGTTVGDPEIS